MKTNLISYNKLKLKRRFEADEEEEDDYVVSDDNKREYDEELAKEFGRYLREVRKSENFEVGDYPFPGTRIRGDRKQMMTGVSLVAKVYDSSHSCPRQGLFVDRLLCFSRLAMAFYNIRMGTYFRVVKVLMATSHGLSVREFYITFEAFSLKSKRNTGGALTFQTKVLVFQRSYPCPKFQILFVRIKPDHDMSKNSQPSEIDRKAQGVEDHLSQVIKTYTIDSRLDSRYSLALYLSQYALVSHNIHVLSLSVAKHDIESLKVLKLVKPVAEVPTYFITFEAPLRAETERKSVETFETEICMPTLFPTITIELKSKARVITDTMDMECGPLD